MRSPHPRADEVRADPVGGAVPDLRTDRTSEPHFEAGADKPEASESLPPRAWGALLTLCAAQALEVLGVTVVIVALPVIGADLGLADAPSGAARPSRVRRFPPAS